MTDLQNKEEVQKDFLKEELKNPDIWDDSALVRAYESALENYFQHHTPQTGGEHVPTEEWSDYYIGESQDKTQENLFNVYPSSKKEEPEVSENASTNNPTYPTSPSYPTYSASWDSQQTNNPSSNFCHVIPAQVGNIPPQLHPPLHLPLNGINDESLSYLLLSWYYSGYYQGMYQGSINQRAQIHQTQTHSDSSSSSNDQPQ
eukprot:TRINITY_DN6039_c0_g1_i1.p1 TRINITY_DN6039_c0_g1~~TRINITY_DN6039_c0_g1_i1.p1  ORF type:complete len:202 (-),score=45.48 TRINITY_DN6039_c0_g1_i1:249-854(-)